MQSALLQAIRDALRADIDPIDTIRVYGDWLQSRGDPHGELIALACALDDARDDDIAISLLSDYRRLSRELLPELFGTPALDTQGLQLSLKRGFLHDVTIEVPSVPAAQLSSLVSRPAATCLRAATLKKPAGVTLENVHGPIAPTLASLARCEHIRELSFSFLPWTRDELQTLANQFASLHTLDFHACTFPDALDAELWLSAFSRLRTFKLLGREYPAPILNAIRSTDDLRTLHLYAYDVAANDALSRMARIAPLEQLYVDFHKPYFRDVPTHDRAHMFDMLATHDHVNVCFDGVTATDDDYRQLARVPSMRELMVCSESFTNEHVSALKHTTGLQSLALLYTRCDDGVIQALPELPTLCHLDLHDNRYLTGAALTCLERLPGLQELELSDIRAFDDATVERIARCRGLQLLDITDCQGRRPGALAALGSLHELRTLLLAMLPDVVVDDVAFVTQLPHLRDMTWFDLSLTEAMFDILLGCRGLRKLSLASCKLDQAWLARLAALPLLMELNLDQASISSNAITRLRSLMPACQIIA